MDLEGIGKDLLYDGRIWFWEKDGEREFGVENGFFYRGIGRIVWVGEGYYVKFGSGGFFNWVEYCDLEYFIYDELFRFISKVDWYYGFGDRINWKEDWLLIG